MKIDLKNKKEVKEELYRELNTMERDDLIDVLVGYMNDKDKKNFVEEWIKSGED